jgi:hypothetical protein
MTLNEQAPESRQRALKRRHVLVIASSLLAVPVLADRSAAFAQARSIECLADLLVL